MSRRPFSQIYRSDAFERDVAALENLLEHG